MQGRSCDRVTVEPRIWNIYMLYMHTHTDISVIKLFTRLYNIIYIILFKKYYLQKLYII